MRSVALIVVVLFGAAPAPAAMSQQALVLSGVTVIDGTGAKPRPDQTVVVQGGRITAVGERGRVGVPKGADIRNLAGKFVVPGFIDMHAHVAMGPVTMPSGPASMRMGYDDAASREQTTSLLAFGITTIRNPAGPTREAVAIRDAVRTGTLRGPRIFTAGNVIDRSNVPGLTAPVATEADVRAEVDRQADAGVDYIKLYAGLTLPLVKAGIEEAHLRGVKAIAHLFATSWTDAAKAGIDGIVHIIPGTPLLLPAEKRPLFLKSIRGTQFMIEWFDYVDLDSPEINEMLETLVSRHINLDPTLVAFEAMARGNDTLVTRSPDLAFAPPSLLASWRDSFTLSIGWTERDFHHAQETWPRVLAFTKRLYDAGVLLTVGTDLSNPWMGPASYHRELQLLVDAGIPPLEVLSLATRNGAKALGILDDVGTVETGKRADLVVLGKDPAADIRNSRSIDWVVQGGRIERPSAFLPSRIRKGAAFYGLVPRR